MENELSKIKIILVDNNEQMRETLKAQLTNEKLEVVANFSDAITALNYIKENEVDVIVTDIVLPNIDGYEFLDALNKQGLSYRPKVLILSALSNDNFINKALSHGADYYMVKPCDINVLKERITELNNGGNYKNKAAPEIKTVKPRNKQLEEKITNIFITVGIPAHIKGYQFLREAIKMAIDNPEIINSITKKLYPSIAERFETSASKVERAIRHAIEVAWNRGKIENINALFGIRVYSNNEKPTNGEFIALVADKMLIEGA